MDAFNLITKQPNLQIYHNQYEFIDENGQQISSFEWKRSNNVLKDICTGNFLACIGVFISEQLYKKHKFDENKELTGTEDWDFWLRVIADVKNIGKIDKVNSVIVDHSDRTMNNINIDDLIKRRLYIINKIENSPDLKKVYQK